MFDILVSLPNVLRTKLNKKNPDLILRGLLVYYAYTGAILKVVNFFPFVTKIKL